MMAGPIHPNSNPNEALPLELTREEALGQVLDSLWNRNPNLREQLLGSRTEDNSSNSSNTSSRGNRVGALRGLTSEQALDQALEALRARDLEFQEQLADPAAGEVMLRSASRDAERAQPSQSNPAKPSPE